MGDNKTTKVIVELHAQTLPNVAGFGKGISDPFAIVTVLGNNPNEKPRILGKTEVIKNTLSPRWTTTFTLDYALSQNTRINVGIWDEVRKGENKPMGSAMFEIGEVLGARGNTKAKKLRKGGTLFVRVTAAPEQDYGMLHLNLRGIKLKNVDGVFGKSDPFFEISAKVNAAGGLTWQPVYRSKPIMNDLNPNWPPFSLDVGRLCAGDLNRSILIEIWDWEKSGKHTSMGQFETSVQGLIEALTDGDDGKAKTVDTSKAFTPMRKGKEFGKIVVTTAKLASPASRTTTVSLTNKPSLQTAGTAVAAVGKMNKMEISDATKEAMPLPPPLAPPLPPPLAPPVRPKFVDYLTGGLELELTIAVDFTGSNGDPRIPGTLHYRHPDGQLNDYEKAITAVGGIIARYDADQKFPVFGFGAKYGGVIQHCFQVGSKPEMDGIAGVLDAYRQVFRTGLTMSGPTVFNEVIDYAAAAARSKQDGYRRIGKQAYKILLILTDGAVTDVEATKRSLQAASDAPLSVVIVGIGNADFSAMQDLDDFMQNSIRRDIVQFVEFSKHAFDKSSLTKATLEEIPDQLVDYFVGQDINPLPPISGSQLSLNPEDPTDEDIDLSMDINTEGEISLENYNGAVYDDTKYATINDYSTLKPISPPAAPYQATASFVPGGVAVNPTVQPQVVRAVQPQQKIFYVQVPTNVSPGMQLRVLNPSTQQMMLVTVPAGVPPGGKIGVQY